MAMQKALPRRGSVAGDILSVVATLEQEMASLTEDNTILERRITTLDSYRARAEAYEQLVQTLVGCRVKKTRIQARVDAWRSEYKRAHGRDPTASDMPAELQGATAELATVQADETEVLERMLRSEPVQDVRRITHQEAGGKWHPTQFRWTVRAAAAAAAAANAAAARITHSPCLYRAPPLFLSAWLPVLR